MIVSTILLLVIIVSALVLMPVSLRSGVARARARMLVMRSSDSELLHRLHGPHQQGGDTRRHHPDELCECC